MEFENGQFVVVGPVTRVMSVWLGDGAGVWEFVIEVEGNVTQISNRQFGSDVAALRAGLNFWLDGGFQDGN